MAIPNLMLYLRLAAFVTLITCAQIAHSAGLLRDSDIEEGLSRLAAPVYDCRRAFTRVDHGFGSG